MSIFQTDDPIPEGNDVDQFEEIEVNEFGLESTKVEISTTTEERPSSTTTTTTDTTTTPTTTTPTNISTTTARSTARSTAAAAAAAAKKKAHSCCGVIDETEAKLARIICPCNTCREHLLCGNSRRTLYFFMFLMGLLWIFGWIIQSLEAEDEINSNHAYVDLMAEIRVNISGSAYDELLSFLGIDDIRGSENWVDYHPDEKDWKMHYLSSSNAAFYVFTLAATIGYGDFAPATSGGKLVSILAAMVTIPITFFLYVKLARLTFQGIIYCILRRDNEVQLAFASCDKSGDGFIEYNELHHALKRLRIHLSPEEVHGVMAQFDADGDGVLDINEFQQIAVNFDVDVNGIAVEQ